MGKLREQIFAKRSELAAARRAGDQTKVEALTKELNALYGEQAQKRDESRAEAAEITGQDVPAVGRGPHGYDPNTVVTLEATVRAAKPTPPMPSLEVEAEFGQVVTVILGPPWYLERTGITFAPGDRGIVEGSKVMEDSGQVVVVAARVEKVREKVTLRLRDEQGLPLWGGMGGGRGGRAPMQ